MSVGVADPPGPRHRADAGYARGQRTRRRIVEAALRLFGERGYDGASTRDIAAAAGVNAPALQYYFGSKEGVYRACAATVAAGALARFSPVVDGAQAVVDTVGATPEQLFEAFGWLLEAVADHHQVPQEAAHRRWMLAQAQRGQAPGALFEVLDRGLRRRVARVAGQLVGRYCGIDPTDAWLAPRIMMLFGQAAAFSMGPHGLAGGPECRPMTATEVRMFKQLVREQCRVLLDHWRQDAQGAGSR